MTDPPSTNALLAALELLEHPVRIDELTAHPDVGGTAEHVVNYLGECQVIHCWGPDQFVRSEHLVFFAELDATRDSFSSRIGCCADSTPSAVTCDVTAPLTLEGEQYTAHLITESQLRDLVANQLELTARPVYSCYLEPDSTHIVPGGPAGTHLVGCEPVAGLCVVALVTDL